MKGALRNFRAHAPMILGVVSVLIALGLVWMLMQIRERPDQPVLASVEPPPDLAPLRSSFLAGVAALEAGDAAKATAAFESFTLAPRPVEEYRLYYLATARQLGGNPEAARQDLARLWRRGPRMVYRFDVAFNLAGLYEASGHWRAASEVLGQLAASADQDAMAAAARVEYARHRIRAGDPYGALSSLRTTIVESPVAAPTADAVAAMRSLAPQVTEPLALLTDRDRLQRVEKMLDAGRADLALTEIERIPSGVGPQRVRLARGRALQMRGKLEESAETVEPLFSDRFRWAIPALDLAAENHRRLIASIQVEKTRTEKIKVQRGTRVVTRKKKKVRVPHYVTETRTVKYVDAEAKQKRDRQIAIYRERLEDLLSLPLDEERHVKTLLRRIDLAEQENEEQVLRRRIPELTSIDPLQDPALQHYWDRSWGAFRARRLDDAEKGFDFIRRAYRSPAVRRQATYWYARTIGLKGQEEEAMGIYRALAEAPFQDIYAMYSEERGAEAPTRAAGFEDAPDWHEQVAEGMPADLQLAYGLTELGALRDARLELRANVAKVDTRWQDAIFGQILYLEGNPRSGAVYLRRAFPALSSAEQLSIPRQFLRLYYPLEYEELIREHSRERNVDPHLIMALIHQESGYDPEARSHVGAMGLMQLMPATAAEIGRKIRIPFAEQRRTDPETNIRMGTYYLRQLIGMVGGDWRLALAAYNGGIGNVWKWQKQNPKMPADEFLEGMPFGETRTYVKRITLIRSTYEQLYGDAKSSGTRPAKRSDNPNA